MKKILKVGIGFLAAFLLDVHFNSTFSQESEGLKDSLPSVLGDNHADLLESNLRHQANLMAATHQIPSSLDAWEKKRKNIRNSILKNSGIKVDHNLPLDLRETGSVQMEGYSVKNIYFQTQPGVYATANLYIPEGKGPFPAVVNMHGHWMAGKADESVQSVAHTLAKNGYVCLTIDAFGAGERSSTHREFEYHGANLGASLMNIGESLLGVQVIDNMRAVDLLVSLPYVDPENIGATGASGGGNQTMWFGALDERIKAALPIVSVGTFESAVMRSNCVCELMPGGLTFTETAGVLAMYAPRALKMCNHEQDSNPTFYPKEMLRSYQDAKPVFRMFGKENHIAFELLDLTHGYWKEDREVLLGWFDLHLKGKGTGEAKKETPFEQIPEEDLMVFETGDRDPLVMNIAEYSRSRGEELRKTYLGHKSFDISKKKIELRSILQLKEPSELVKIHRYPSTGGWERIALETSDNKLIPVLHFAPENNTGTYTILSDMDGKQGLPSSLLEELKQKDSGIIIVELSGTGEASSSTDVNLTRLSRFHTLARANLWLGKTMLGEWVKELELVADFVQQNYNPQRLHVEGDREAGLAALFLAATGDTRIEKLVLKQAPASYLFDKRENIDFFSMGIHLPGFLNWGDISLAAGLTGKEISFIDPLSMSGEALSQSQSENVMAEFEKINNLCGQGGKITFAP